MFVCLCACVLHMYLVPAEAKGGSSTLKTELEMAVSQPGSAGNRT